MVFCCMQQLSKEGSHAVVTRLKCAAGLAELATKKYKSAAKYFLQANFDHCDFPEVRNTTARHCIFVVLSCRLAHADVLKTCDDV